MKFFKQVFIFILFIIFNYTLVFGQNDTNAIAIDVKMTEVFKDSRKLTDLSFSVADNKGGVYVVRRYNKGYYIEKYDDKLNITKEYDIEVLKNEGNIENAFLRGENLCLIQSHFDKSNKVLKYYSRTLQKDKNTFDKELLFSVPLKNIKKPRFFSGMFGKDSNSDNDVLGNFKTSNNSEFIAFTIDILDLEVERHTVYVFNNDLEKVSQTEFVRGIKDRKFILQNIDVSEEDGTIYLLGKTYTKEKKSKKEGGKYQFELYKMQGETKQSMVFDSGENFIGSLTVELVNNNLFCVGFYSEKNDNRYKGLVHFAIKAEDLTLKSKKYSPFTEQFMIDKYGKDKVKELRNIVFKNIHVTEDNDCILIAEEFYIQITQTMGANGMMGGQSTTYNYRDIICAKLSSDGTLQWARNINKKQTSNNADRYLSFTSTYQNDMSYLFINTNGKIKKLRKDRIEFRGGSSNNADLNVITVDANGDFKFKTIVDSKEAEVPFEAGAAVITNKGKSLIFKGRVRSKKQLLKISI